MYDEETDGWTRLTIKEPTLNLFFNVFNVLFKKKAISHWMRNFSHSMRNFSLWQSPPDRVTLNQSASPLSSLYHPKAISVTNKQLVSALLKIHSFAKRWPKKVFLPSFYDGKIDGQTSQRTNELTVNLHLMFFTFFSRKKHFRIVCEIFRITSQHHPKTDSVTPKQSASPLSSLHHL